MEMYMDGRNALKRLQREFTGEYPYLKMDLLEPNRETARPIKRNDVSLFVRIDRSRTVAQLVKDVEEILGFTVEIFRRSGTVWIWTFLTENWTLEQQNTEGENISRMK